MKYKKYLLEFIIWCLIFAILISLIYYNIQKKEDFASISSDFKKVNNLDKMRLRTLVSNYESKNRCCEGYYTPSNGIYFYF